MKKYLIVLYLLLLICLVSCSKNDNQIIQSEKTTISKINRIELTDVSVDTVWRSADTILLHYATAQKELQFGDLYKDVMDSINLDFNALNDSFIFKKDIMIPSFKQDGTLFVNDNDSLLVEKFPIVSAYYSSQRTVTQTKYNGSIKNIQIIPLYQRVYINGIAKVEIMDEENRIRIINASFKSSRVSNLSVHTNVWD